MESFTNINNICRICASNIRKTCSVISIFGPTNIYEKLQKYLHIDVDQNDCLPQIVCQVCYKKIESVHNFALSAKKTEVFLRNYLMKSMKNPEEQLTYQPNNSMSYLVTDEISNSKVIPITNNLYTTNDNIDKSAKVRCKNPNELMEIKLLQNSITNTTTTNVNNIQGNNIKQNFRKILVNTNSISSIDPIESQFINNNETQSIISSTNYINTPPNDDDSETEDEDDNDVSYDELLLGGCIRDMDLLKLILKALKWPYNAQTLDSQVLRLKNTKFREVMLDQNLLLDTDLMQILNNYLSPILLQSNTITAPQSELVAYKIPADTSVHIINVPNDEQQNTILPTSKQKNKIKNNFNRPQFIENSSPIEILSEDSDGEIQLFEVNVDPNLYFPQDYDFNTANNTIGTINLNNSRNNNTNNINNDKLNIKKKKKNRKYVGKNYAIDKLNKQKSNEFILSDKNNGINIKRNTQQESSDGITINCRKKQKRKDTNLKLHEEKDGIIIIDSIDENSTNLLDINKKICNTEDNFPKENEILSTEQDNSNVITLLDDEYSQITLMDENSNDDALWAEFKVIDSSESSLNEEIIDKNVKEKLKQKTKKKKIIDTINIKTDSNLIENDDNIDDDLNDVNTYQIISEIKEETPVDVEEINSNENFIEPTIEHHRNDIDLLVKIENPSRVKRKYNKRKKNFKHYNRILTRSISSSKGDDTNIKNTKEMNKKRNVESNLDSKKQRKRMCKDCSYTTNNLMEYIDHRKIHVV